MNTRDHGNNFKAMSHVNSGQQCSLLGQVGKPSAAEENTHKRDTRNIQ